MLNELLLTSALQLRHDANKPVVLTKDRAVELTTPMAKHVAKGVLWLSPEQAGLMLITIGAYESDFIRSRQTCEETGDNGLAVTVYQMHSWGGLTREQVCASHDLATKAAVSHLRLAAFKCEDDKTIECVFARYWSATATKEWLGVQKRSETFHTLARKVGVEP